VFYRGRVGLYALLKALGVEPGDQVAVQAFTCLAVPEGVIASGASPLWVDVEPDGFNMDPEDLRRKLTHNTKVIIVQHTYGIPADMKSIMAIAEEHGIPVIEDCAHTLISRYHGRRTGTFGVAAFYSYEWGKPVVAGVGGSVIINDKDLEDKMRSLYRKFYNPPLLNRLRITLQYYGFNIIYRPMFYWPVRSIFHFLSALGIAEGNYNPVTEAQEAEDFSWRMAPETAARLKRKLPYVQEWAKHSRRVVEQYRQGIRSSSVVHPTDLPGVDPVFVRYPLRVPNKVQLLRQARKRQIELSDWYATPIHPLSGAELRSVFYEPGSCPNAERRAREVVTLPTHTRVTSRDIARTIQFFNEVFS